MTHINAKISSILKNKMLARVLISVIPWILLGAFNRIGSDNGIRVTFSDPIDIKLFLGLMAAYIFMAFGYTAASEWFQDDETISESKQAKSYTYENMASSFFTLAGGLAFLLVSGRSNIPWNWLAFFFFICCMTGVIFQKLSLKILGKSE